jgi:tetrahydromethanopterin S-methyltransferase subunit A
MGAKHSLMRALGKLMPQDPSGERATAVRMIHRMEKESPVFQPAQGLRALFQNGVSAERRIAGADGHLPVLDHLPIEQIESFRRQVALVARGAEPFQPEGNWMPNENRPGEPAFKVSPPGGGGKPIEYDPLGFWVLTLDREAGQIVARHHRTDNAPAHEIRARTAEGILQSMLRHGLVSQLEHAGYLGIELAKAEAALTLGARFEQDQPLRAG